jgi:hypothetical protein
MWLGIPILDGDSPEICSGKGRIYDIARQQVTNETAKTT